MVHWTIRRMTIGDYDEVLDLWKKAGLNNIRKLGRDSRESIQRQLSLENCIFLVAEMNKKMIGVVIGSHDGRKGWINRLAVDPEFRNRGVAQSLILKVEEELKKMGIRVFSALIFESNIPSLNLFSKMGYRTHRSILYLSKRLDEEA